MPIDEKVFAVPVVAGLTVEAASELLHQQHLIPFDMPAAEPSEVFGVGTVIGTSPPAGEGLPPGSFVTLIVSTGHTPTGFVPVVAGLPADLAVGALEFEGYVVVTRDQESATVEPGSAIGTAPRAGTSLFPESLVTLFVAITPLPLPPPPPRGDHSRVAVRQCPVLRTWSRSGRGGPEFPATRARILAILGGAPRRSDSREGPMEIHRLGDISVLSDPLPIPGIGFLPVNAYVLHAAEPVVIDTGLSLPDRAFVDSLGSFMDPRDVRWIWLTHPDRDHTGGLFALLEAAPQARVITTFVGAGIMSTERPIPLDRVYLLNPGQSIDVGDRTLTAFRPPLYDSPVTTGFYDDKSRVCVSSDCFGAPMPSAETAGASGVDDVPPDVVRAGQLTWATLDSPWVLNTDPAKFGATIEPLRGMDPSMILSTHLPPASGDQVKAFLEMLTLAPDAEPFVGPDQRALEEMLASFEPGGHD